MRWPRGGRDERGMSISVWAAICMPAFILALGLGVDFSGHASAEQEARLVAGEAARAGAQQSDVARGSRDLNLARAMHAAERFGRAAGYATTATVGGETVEVRLTGRYRTRFLGLIGVHSIPFEVSGSARYVPVADQTQEDR